MLRVSDFFEAIHLALSLSHRSPVCLLMGGRGALTGAEFSHFQHDGHRAAASGKQEIIILTGFFHASGKIDKSYLRLGLNGIHQRHPLQDLLAGLPSVLVLFIPACGFDDSHTPSSEREVGGSWRLLKQDYQK